MSLMTNLRLKFKLYLTTTEKTLGLFFENILAGAALNPHLRYNYNPDLYTLR